MNHLDWVDVVKLSIMTVLPLGMRLGFSKKAFLDIFQDKKLFVEIKKQNSYDCHQSTL